MLRCPKCDSGQLQYVQRVHEYHEFENKDWPQIPGDVEFVCLCEATADDEFESFIICAHCRARFTLAGKPVASEDKVVPVALAAEDWSEVMNALESKALLVERGDYGEGDVEGSEFDPEAWARHLRAIYAGLEPVLKAAGINF